MADGGGLALPQEEPSVALDRLFLELHEHLPKAAREKFAQLADEVKCLTETSSAEAPMAPQSSGEQAVVRRDEEIATINAKQSSGKLQARGEALHMLSEVAIRIRRCMDRQHFIVYGCLLQVRLLHHSATSPP